jgi:hypothetical protein
MVPLVVALMPVVALMLAVVLIQVLVLILALSLRLTLIELDMVLARPVALVWIQL